MTLRNVTCRRLRALLATLGLAAMAISVTGCQMDIAGQTLPSPYYIYDDVQLYSHGSEFKLSREAAYMEKARADADIAP